VAVSLASSKPTMVWPLMVVTGRVNAAPSLVSKDRLRFDRKSWILSHSLYRVLGFGNRWMRQSLATSEIRVLSAKRSSAGFP
jgi:hypothetical protein